VENQRKLQLQKLFQITCSSSTNFLGIFITPSYFPAVEFNFEVYFTFGNNRPRGPPVSNCFPVSGPLVRGRHPPGRHATSAGRGLKSRPVTESRHRHRLHENQPPPSTRTPSRAGVLLSPVDEGCTDLSVNLVRLRWVPCRHRISSQCRPPLPLTHPSPPCSGHRSLEPRPGQAHRRRTELPRIPSIEASVSYHSRPRPGLWDPKRVRLLSLLYMVCLAGPPMAGGVLSPEQPQRQAAMAAPCACLCCGACLGGLFRPQPSKPSRPAYEQQLVGQSRPMWPCLLFSISNLF
jgi:hypothetical protein